MQAWHFRSYGTPHQSLELDDVRVPKPGPGEVLVEVAAAAVGFADLLMCRGEYHHKPEHPFTGGSEAAGIVVDRGADVEIDIGSRVLTAPMTYGCFAEQVVVDAGSAFPIPDAMPSSLASGFFIPYQTAYVSLFTRGRLNPGEIVLVNGGSGAVGSAAIELAKAAGAVVIAAAGSEEKRNYCLELGADTAVDHSVDNFRDLILEHTSGRGVDIVIDPVGGRASERSSRCIAFGGRLVIVGFASGKAPEIRANHLLMKNYDVLGVRLQPYREDRLFSSKVHAELMDDFRKGKIGRIGVQNLDFNHLPEALTAIEQRQVVGRVAIRREIA